MTCVGRRRSLLPTAFWTTCEQQRVSDDRWRFRGRRVRTVRWRADNASAHAAAARAPRARCAAGAPHAYRPVATDGGELFGQEFLAQVRPGAGVAKERRDADKKIMKQLDRLLTVLSQTLDVVLDIAQSEHLHAALAAAGLVSPA